MSEKAAVPPAGRALAVQVVMSIPSSFGAVVQVKIGPAVCVTEARVALAGTASVITTFCAASGPLLVAVSVKVTLLPAVICDGPDLVIARSAFGAVGLRTEKVADTRPTPRLSMVLTV